VSLLVDAPVVASVEDRQALRKAVADVLSARSPEALVRATMGEQLGYDPALWSVLANQLGLQGLVIPEAQGGAGCGFGELGVVLEELGRALYTGPLLGTVLAAHALVRAGALPNRMRELASGALFGALALEQPTGGVLPSPGVACTDDRLSGRASYVLDGHLDGLLVLEADDVDGRALYAVEPGAAGVALAVLTTTDQTRRLAEVMLDGTPAIRLGGPTEVAHLRAAAAVALACQAVGGAEATLATALAYAKVRTQFGRVIGSFQAIKHQLAELFLLVESAKAAARRAARAVAEDDPELELFASIAKGYCSDAYVRTTVVSLQVHGGIGYTWEHITHLHLKRAKTDELLFGDARYHRTHLADLLGV
jgi:alkylation response protein AidB-like acyl-CoA dehydrogenase